MLRKKVASKARKVIKAQEEKEAPVPKIVDEGPTGQGEPKPKTPAPAAEPDLDKAEEEAKEEIKHEQKEEATLDTIKDVLEEIVDALGDQKKVLEKALTGKTEEEEDFEEFKDEEKDESEEEFTPEEFGINPEDLTVGREEKMTAAKRRKARKTRLYKFAKKARTLSEEFEEDKAKKKTFKPSAPAPSITKVKKDETPDMFKLASLALELNDAKDKWTVLHTASDGSEKPIYEINKKDEENFSTKDFGNQIFADMKEKGVQETLKAYGAEPFKTINDKKDEKPTEDEEEKKTIGDYKRQFNRAFRLAVSAMDKNLVQNPLKGAFYEILTGVGLDEKTAMNAIESAFNKGAVDHIETALAQTDKYLEMSDEALVETEATIGDLRVKTPEFEDSEEEVTPQVFSSKAEAMRKRAAKASLPLSTDSESSAADRVNELFSALPKPKLSGISRL